MGIKIEINGGQMKVNGQEVDLNDPEVAKKYGTSGPIKGMTEEEKKAHREKLAKAQEEREAGRTKTRTEESRTSGSKATIFGLTAEQLANADSLNLGPNVSVRMKNVNINDTHISDFKYDGNKSNQDTEERKEDFDFLSVFDDDFEIGPEIYEQAYRETKPQQKGVFAKLKELIRNISRSGEDYSER